MQHLRGWWGFTTLHHTLERNGRPRFLSRRQNLANDGECTPEVVGRDWFCSDGKTVFSVHGFLEFWTNVSFHRRITLVDRRCTEAASGVGCSMFSVFFFTRKLFCVITR